jgi:CheY-like chemotaxis protein/glycine cleavage system H lipoate-binding protein
MNGSTPERKAKGDAVGEKPRILVIDDEPVILDSVRRILTAEGFPVLVVSDAESALEILKTDPQEIAICDLMLPGLSGLEFLEASQRDDPSLVVIITTGYATVDNGVDALRKGAFDFLPKPFTFEELVSQVDRASRFASLPIALRVQPPAAEFAGCHLLGSQAWTRPDVDGSWLLGLAAVLLRTIDPIRNIEFPDAGGELHQGGPLVRMTTEDGLVHDVWSPLSGEILQVNERLRETPDLPHRDPVTEGWLLRVLPANLEQELPALTAAHHGM